MQSGGIICRRKIARKKKSDLEFKLLNPFLKTILDAIPKVIAKRVAANAANSVRTRGKPTEKIFSERW